MVFQQFIIFFSLLLVIANAVQIALLRWRFEKTTDKSTTEQMRLDMFARDAARELASMRHSVTIIERIAYSGVPMVVRDALVMSDGDGKITEWTPGAEGLLGWTREEAIGQDVATLLIPDDMRSGHHAAFSALMASHKTALAHTVTDARALRKDGGQIRVDVHLQGWKQESGKWSLSAIVKPRG